MSSNAMWGEAIEHVPDPLAVMTHVRGLMKPNGLIWLQTPNFRALDGRLFRHRNWAGFHCPRHFAIFSEVGLRRFLARADPDADDVAVAMGGHGNSLPACLSRHKAKGRRFPGAPSRVSDFDQA